MCRCATAALLSFWLAVPAAGGVYNFAENLPSNAGEDLRLFLDSLTEIKRVAAPAYIENRDGTRTRIQSPYRDRAALIEALVPARGAPTDVGENELLDISGYLIRRGKYDEAINLLEPLLGPRPENFLLYANLGSAYQAKGDMILARRKLEKLQQLWPEKWQDLSPTVREYLQKVGGWDEAAFQWYRRAEGYQLKLVEQRFRESLNPRGGGEVGVDDLFGVRYVGADGKFQPGGIAPAQQKKLPDDAGKIVEQLLFWFPADDRLSWQLGELLNATGQPADAATIFNQIVSPVTGKSAPAEWKERRLALDTYLAQNPPQESLPDITLPPPQTGRDKPAQTDALKDDDGGWQPTTVQLLGVGFLAGMIVTVFGYWQLREISRRLRRRA